MKKQKFGNTLLKGLFALAVLIAGAGCTKESATDCNVKYSLAVRAYAANGSDISGEVRDVVLYVFDADGLFTESFETTTGTQVELSTPKGDAITVVAWANASGSNDVFPILTKGQHRIVDCSVGFDPSTRADATVYDSPGDLFNGTVSITRSESAADKVIPMHRRTGSMNITVRKLRELIQSTDDDFSLVVHKTHSRIGFDGSLSGEKNASYKPAGTLDAQGVYSTGVFNLLPSAEGVTIDVYHGAELLRSVTTYGGQPIAIAAAVTTNVLIDFGGNLDVQVSITPWSITDMWKDF